jgi:hypothetical protein
MCRPTDRFKSKFSKKTKNKKKAPFFEKHKKTQKEQSGTMEAAADELTQKEPDKVRSNTDSIISINVVRNMVGVGVYDGARSAIYTTQFSSSPSSVVDRIEVRLRNLFESWTYVDS